MLLHYRECTAHLTYVQGNHMSGGGSVIGRRTHRIKRCVLLAERTQGILNPAIHCIQRVGDKVDAEGGEEERGVCAKKCVNGRAEEEAS